MNHLVLFGFIVMLTSVAFVAMGLLLIVASLEDAKINKTLVALGLSSIAIGDIIATVSTILAYNGVIK